ncbi:unnamed protein product [Closterium sp. Naga37s-1]|nr:unnamed protein product [Closterium sp. Naga37s-1]
MDDPRRRPAGALPSRGPAGPSPVRNPGGSAMNSNASRRGPSSTTGGGGGGGGSSAGRGRARPLRGTSGTSAPPAQRGGGGPGAAPPAKSAAAGRGARSGKGLRLRPARPRVQLRKYPGLKPAISRYSKLRARATGQLVEPKKRLRFSDKVEVATWDADVDDDPGANSAATAGSSLPTGSKRLFLRNVFLGAKESINDAAESLFGQSKKELPKDLPTEFVRDAPRSKELKKAYKKEQRARGDSDYAKKEHRPRTKKDGETRERKAVAGGQSANKGAGRGKPGVWVDEDIESSEGEEDEEWGEEGVEQVSLDADVAAAAGSQVAAWDGVEVKRLGEREAEEASGSAVKASAASQAEGGTPRRMRSPSLIGAPFSPRGAQPSPQMGAPAAGVEALTLADNDKKQSGAPQTNQSVACNESEPLAVTTASRQSWGSGKQPGSRRSTSVQLNMSDSDLYAHSTDDADYDGLPVHGGGKGNEFSMVSPMRQHQQQHQDAEHRADRFVPLSARGTRPKTFSDDDWFGEGDGGALLVAVVAVVVAVAVVVMVVREVVMVAVGEEVTVVMVVTVVEERGTAVEERGTAVEERGTVVEERGTAVEERGTVVVVGGTVVVGGACLAAQEEEGVRGKWFAAGTEGLVVQGEAEGPRLQDAGGWLTGQEPWQEWEVRVAVMGDGSFDGLDWKQQMAQMQQASKEQQKDRTFRMMADSSRRTSGALGMEREGRDDGRA